MIANLDYGLLYCDDKEVFYAELMCNDEQWGEIILSNDNGEPMITMWECNFTVPTKMLTDFVSKASEHLKEFEQSKQD